METNKEERPIQQHRQAAAAPASIACKTCSQAMWSNSINQQKKCVTEAFCGVTRAKVWDSAWLIVIQEAGVVDCSSYLAWRGRSEDDQKDDLSAEAITATQALFQAKMAAVRPPVYASFKG